jgi:hypothetical protein
MTPETLDNMTRLTCATTYIGHAVSALRAPLAHGVTPLEADVIYGAITALVDVARRLALILESQP